MQRGSSSPFAAARSDIHRPLLLAGSQSTIGGIALVLASVRENPTLDPLALFVAAGGTEFVIRAGLLARRRRLATVPA